MSIAYSLQEQVALSFGTATQNIQIYRFEYSNVIYFTVYGIWVNSEAKYLIGKLNNKYTDTGYAAWGHSIEKEAKDYEGVKEFFVDLEIKEQFNQDLDKILGE